MVIVIALVVCLVTGLFGGASRTGKIGWAGAAAAAITLALVAYGYRDDARKLPKWYEKRDDVLTSLRTHKVCLDMEVHPERWQGSGLEYPCIGYGAEQLRSQIAEEQDLLESWNVAIRNRQALLKTRESGQFSFIQRWVGNPYE